jgi:DNA-binding transcriptional ArsR family regulator
VPDRLADTPIDQPLSARVLQDTASMFGLLSATVRLQILWQLASGDHDVTTLAAATGHSVATVSNHLSKLKLAGIVQARRQGKRQVYIAADSHAIEVVRLAVGQRLESSPVRAQAHLA